MKYCTFVLVVAAPLFAQAPTRPSFDVASVKPNKTGDVRFTITSLAGGRFLATNASLKMLITTAYGVRDSEIVGGPNWIDTDKFDVEVKTVGTIPAMLATSLDQLAGALGTTLDRPVINKTGVSGLFDFHLEFEPDQATPGAIPLDQLASDTNGGPPLAVAPTGISIFTAVKDLGLKLQRAKGPRQFLVIDHAERPTEN